MSLLADLLSKIKQPQTTREVPPNLKHIVQSSASKSATKRKAVLLSGLVCVLILTGLIFVYFVNKISETSDTGTAPRQHAATVHQFTDKPGSPARDDKSKDAGHVNQLKKADAPATTVKSNRKKSLVKRRRPERIVSDSTAVTSIKKTTKASTAMSVEKTKEIDAGARDALLYKAREFEMRQDYSSALSTYKEALEIDNTNVIVLNSIAYIYLKLGLEQESIQYARMAEEQDVDYTPALINLGIAYAKTGNISAAEYYLERAFKLEPDNKQAIFNLALLHEKKQNFTNAADFFSKLIKLGDSSGTLGLARTYEMQDRNKEALNLYKNAALMESFDHKTKRQIRQRIMILENEGQGTESSRPTGPATEVTR